jgi:hypothetical protein
MGDTNARCPFCDGEAVASRDLLNNHNRQVDYRRCSDYAMKGIDRGVIMATVEHVETL